MVFIRILEALLLTPLALAFGLVVGVLLGALVALAAPVELAIKVWQLAFE